jgi:PAS domain S-box-containing protein
MLLDLNSCFEIDQANCVDAAFQKLATCNYDVVVSDFDMPQKTGLQFLQEFREQKKDIPFILFTGKGREEVVIKALNLGADGYINKQGDPETVYGELKHSIQLNVERKKAQASLLRSEIQLQCLLDINKMLDASDKELMDYALEAIANVTLSKFAFIGLINQDETEMSIHSWSKNAMKECSTISKPIHYPISKAGVWAEPIRQRKPISIDDYSASIQCKKGLPQGHVAIKRFLGVPVFEKEHIVAIAAVANKKERYTETDVDYITSLVTDMWRLIQRKKAETALEESYSKHKAISSIIADVAFSCLKIEDENFAIDWITGATEKVFGCSPEEIKNHGCWKYLVDPKDEPVFEKNVVGLNPGQSSTCELRIIPDDGSIRWIRVFSIVEEDKSNPKNHRLFGACEDITDIKKIQNTLASSEQKFRKAFATAPDGFYISTLEEGRFVEVNENFTKLFGFTKQEIIGKTSLQLGIWGNPKERERMVTQLKSEGYVRNFEMQCLRKNGEAFPAKFSASMMQSDNQALIVGVIRDISDSKQAEAKISRLLTETQQEKNKYSSLVNSICDEVWFADTDKKFTLANPVAQKEFNLNSSVQSEIEELASSLEIFRADGSPRPLEEAPPIRALRGEIVRNQEELVRTPASGGFRYREVSSAPVRDLEGKIIGAVSVVRDVTDRKKAEISLKEIKTLLELQIKRMPIACIFWDKDFKAVSWNPAAETIFGYSEKEALGKHPYETIVPKETQPIVEKIWRRLLEGDETAHSINDNFTKTGNKITCSWTNTPLRREDNSVIGVLSMVQDITERKKAEEMLLEAKKQAESDRKRLETILDTTPSAVVIIEAQSGKFSFVNKRAMQLYGSDTIGVSLDENLAKVKAWRVDGTEYPIEEIPVTRTLKLGQEVRNEEMLIERADGHVLPIIANTGPLRDIQGNITAAIVVFEDITELKNAELETKQYTQVLENVGEGVDVGLAVINRDYSIVWANKRMTDLGIAPNNKCFEVFNNLGVVCPDCGVERIFQQDVSLDVKEYKTVNSKGETTWVEIRVTPLKDKEGNITAALALVLPITERKKADDALRLSEATQRELINKMNDTAWVIDFDARFVDANETAVKVLGYSIEELLTMGPSDIDSSLNKEQIKNLARRMLSGSKQLFETTHKTKDGKIIPVEISSSIVTYKGKQAILSIARDITEHKKAEEHRKVLERKIQQYSEHLKYLVDLRTIQLKEANQRVVKAERLAAIGELAAMVGHDLRNPLAGIKNAAYFLKKKGHAISEVQYREMLETIDKSINHSDKIINELLEYSREIHLNFEETTLTSLVGAAIKMVHVPDRIQVLNHICDDTAIRVDSDKIMRTFVNLIKNAIDAMPEKGTLEIKSCKTKNHLAIAFTDTGTGIAEETLQKLFTPLFTTKAQGMGFGLAICKRMIEAHKGTINVKTTVNQGTTFTITLPTKTIVPYKEKISTKLC